jgi:hypothetical protein
MGDDLSNNFKETIMKRHIPLWILRSIQTAGLAAVLLASACAPTAPPPPVAVDTPLAVPTQTLEAASQPEAPTEAPAAAAQTPQAIPTSRGPNLEATDPTTVALASGGLQLVEFFRFT